MKFIYEDGIKLGQFQIQVFLAKWSGLFTYPNFHQTCNVYERLNFDKCCQELLKSFFVLLLLLMLSQHIG